MNKQEKKQDGKSQDKMKWADKLAFKIMKRKFKKANRQARKSKDEKKLEKARKGLILAIWEMKKDFDIYDDDEGKVPMTMELLEKKETEKLIEIMEKMIKQVEEAI